MTSKKFLKPCPFCGSYNLYFYEGKDTDRLLEVVMCSRILCVQCQTNFYCNYITDDSLITRWNNMAVK